MLTVETWWIAKVCLLFLLPRTFTNHYTCCPTYETAESKLIYIYIIYIFKINWTRLKWMYWKHLCTIYTQFIISYSVMIHESHSKYHFGFLYYSISEVATLVLSFQNYQPWSIPYGYDIGLCLWLLEWLGPLDCICFNYLGKARSMLLWGWEFIVNKKVHWNK